MQYSPEIGGFTTRVSAGSAERAACVADTGVTLPQEIKRILQGLSGLKIVGADIVEVAPAYDTNAELTTMAAADVSAPSFCVLRPCARPLTAAPGAIRGPERHGEDSFR